MLHHGIQKSLQFNANTDNNQAHTPLSMCQVLFSMPYSNSLYPQDNGEYYYLHFSK